MNQAPSSLQPLPAGACDTHVHVFDPARHPYQACRAYSPGEARVQDLLALHRTLGIARTVLVQPSVYGTDNACLVQALAELGPERARGVAVVDAAQVEGGAVQALHAAGVRGIRLNVEVAGQASLAAVRAQLQGAAWLRQMPGWSLQLHASLDLVTGLADDLAQVGVPVVLDHFAGALKSPEPGGASLAPVLALLRAGHCFVKLSAPYRRHADCSDAQVAAVALALCEAAPERVLWGSDWPHTGGTPGQPRDPRRIEPFRDIDNAAVLTLLSNALGSAQAWQSLLVDNPARLYGFDEPASSRS